MDILSQILYDRTQDCGKEYESAKIINNMFKKLKIKTEKHLQLLFNDSKSSLLNSILEVQYPASLRKKGSIIKWEKNYREIDKLNYELLDGVAGKAGVYSIFRLKKNKQWELQYIGQTQSKTARQRIRSHIVWRNKKTTSGKFTGSLFDEVQRIIISGEKLGFSFIEIFPAPLRHYIEEMLIEVLRPPWNRHKKI